MTLSNPAQYISGRTVQEQMNSLIDYVDTRAADVATDAIASDVAQVHSDAADAHTDALAAAASAAAAAGTLANAVKKTGEASQSIAGDIAVAGALSGGSVSSSGNVDGASIGSGTTPVVCGDLTAYGNVSLDDTALQGNLSVADPSALINLSGAGSVLVPTPMGNSEAATKKYVDDALDNYAPMVRTTGNQNIAGVKTFTSPQEGCWNGHRMIFSAATGGQWYKIGEITKATSTYTYQVMTWTINSGYFNSAKGGIAILALTIPNSSNVEGFIVANKANDATIWSNFAIKIGVKADGNMEVFVKGRDYTSYIFNPISIVSGANNIAPGDCITALTASIVPEPQAADYDQLLTVTA